VPCPQQHGNEADSHPAELCWFKTHHVHPFKEFDFYCVDVTAATGGELRGLLSEEAYQGPVNPMVMHFLYKQGKHIYSKKRAYCGWRS